MAGNIHRASIDRYSPGNIEMEATEDNCMDNNNGNYVY